MSDQLPSPPRRKPSYKSFFVIVLLTCLISCALLILLQAFNSTANSGKVYRIRHNVDSHLAGAVWGRQANCTHWTCFDVYRCGRTGHDRIAVFVYPVKQRLQDDAAEAAQRRRGWMSRQYYEVVKAAMASKYYTSDPEEACLFIPSIDTLNQERLRVNRTSRLLMGLDFWNNGENHLIFNMIAGSSPDYSPILELNTGRALIAGAGFDTFSIRKKFDIAIPVFSPIAKMAEAPDLLDRKRPILATASQLNIDSRYISQLNHLAYKQRPQDLLLVDACTPHNYTSRCHLTSNQHYHYPQLLQNSTFCLIFRGQRAAAAQFALPEAMAANCIPVIVIDSPVMPFADVIDWRHAAVFVAEQHLDTLMDVLEAVTVKRREQMRRTVEFLYRRYFATIEKIVLMTLDVLQDRVFPHWARSYDEINLRPEEINTNPLFLPLTAPKAQGFTAVILTYDRLASLFTLIERLAKVPSLMKVVVVWNHQIKQPPPVADFPKIEKPINVIRSSANKLSNRFYPYKEIETEAILHIDDDIVMLTSDEVEFAYEVWREFPDRIVGFPSRTHIWDNQSLSWKYESEWTNEISMVLTGAAFLHKYWSYLYTNGLPPEVRDWADEQMNCEDIAMNFLVANITNKPPIKVTPRKKFKCPECVNNEMLSADMGHMVERSQCVDRFAKAFGRMPLKSVEFRADPVLFKDGLPAKAKRFNDIGSL